MFQIVKRIEYAGLIELIRLIPKMVDLYVYHFSI